jgi:histone H3/H4
MEDYKRQVGKLAVAQLCQVMGFSCISSQALDTLEEVLRLLIEKIGERAKILAEHSNRTECNFLDTLKSLEVIDYTEENINVCLFQQPEFSFTRVIEFPSSGPVPVPKPISYNHNIPTFLPPFPPDHTYLFTPVPITRNMDINTLRAIKIKEKREIEERLAGIIGENISQPPTPVNIKNPYANLSVLPPTSRFIQDN